MVAFEALQAGDPERVGPYRLVARLGAGGMGRVYLGHSRGGRAFAVKVVRPELSENREFSRRFAREVSAARAVSGAFTASVVDADPEGSPAWLATVYVPGISLADAVAENGRWPERPVLALSVGLAEALESVHRAGIVHRDLKPSNVLLAADGPRVIDFGISVASGASTLTATGMLLGTVGFMSPEQLTGRPVGPAGDVFSLASVLVYTATGKAPFGDGSAPEVLFRTVYEEPDVAAVPDGLREIVLRCLAKEPDERPGLPALLDELEPLARDAGALETGFTSGGWLPDGVAEIVRGRTAGPGAGGGGVPTSAGEPPSTTPPVPRPTDAGKPLPTDSTPVRLPTAEVLAQPRPPAPEEVTGTAHAETLTGVHPPPLVPPPSLPLPARSDAADGEAERLVTRSPSPDQHPHPPTPSRRRFLLGLTGAGFTAAAGLTTWRLLDTSDEGSPPSDASAGRDTGSPSTSPARVSGRRRWVAPIGETPANPVAVANGTVYVGVHGVGVLSLNTATGEKRWEQPSAVAVTTPTVRGDRLYYGDGRSLQALDASNGNDLWTFWTGDDINAAPAVSGGTVYTGSTDGNLYALDAADGTRRWKRRIGPSVTSSPLVADGVVYAAADTGVLTALNAGDGGERWTFPTNGSVESRVTVAGGTVYFGSDDKHLYAVDAATGRQRWKYAMGGQVGSCRPAVADGVVYTTCADHGLHAVDAATGRRRWKLTTDLWLGGSSPVVWGGVVFAGNVLAVDRTTGREVWRQDTSGSSTASPVLTDGVLYVGGERGVWAVEVSRG